METFVDTRNESKLKLVTEHAPASRRKRLAIRAGKITAGTVIGGAIGFGVGSYCVVAGDSNINQPANSQAYRDTACLNAISSYGQTITGDSKIKLTAIDACTDSSIFLSPSANITPPVAKLKSPAYYQADLQAQHESISKVYYGDERNHKYLEVAAITGLLAGGVLVQRLGRPA